MQQKDIQALLQKYSAGTATPKENALVEAWYEQLDTQKTVGEDRLQNDRGCGIQPSAATGNGAGTLAVAADSSGRFDFDCFVGWWLFYTDGKISSGIFCLARALFVSL